MANYSITYSCGHTLEKQLYGKQTERDRYIAWASEKGACAACQAADKTKVMEAVEVENDLPAMTGSDKQVAWARAIRAEKIADVQKFFGEVRAKTPADKIELFEQLAVAFQALAEKTSASWWIDRRGEAGRLVAAAAFKAAVE